MSRKIDELHRQWEDLLRPRPNRGMGGGTTRKIADLDPRPCRHPQHEVPSMRVFSPGVWEHTCPGCGNKIIFTVNQPWL